MKERLRKREVNYIQSTYDWLKKLGRPLFKQDILWILNRFFIYAAKMLTHGYPVTIPGTFSFSLYHVSSSNYEAMEKEHRYARSSAVHGVFFSVKCEGKLIDQYKPDFKPSLKFRRLMEAELTDADLAYKLITG